MPKFEQPPAIGLAPEKPSTAIGLAPEKPSAAIGLAPEKPSAAIGLAPEKATAAISLTPEKPVTAINLPKDSKPPVSEASNAETKEDEALIESRKKEIELGADSILSMLEKIPDQADVTQIDLTFFKKRLTEGMQLLKIRKDMSEGRYLTTKFYEDAQRVITTAKQLIERVIERDRSGNKQLVESITKKPELEETPSAVASRSIFLSIYPKNKGLQK